MMTAVPEPYLSAEVPDRLTQHILGAFNAEGLTSEQSRQALNGGEAID